MGRARISGLWILLASMALFLLGCARMMESAAAKPEGRYAREALDALSTGKIADVRDRLADAAKSPDVDQKLAALAAVYPSGPPTEIQLFNYHFREGLRGDGTYVFTFVSVYPDTHVLTRITVVSTSGRLQLNHIHGQRVNPSADTFGFTNAGVIHYLSLVLAAACPIVMVFAFVRWLRTRHTLRRKWLWLIAIWVGVEGFALNWSTGEINISSFTVRPLGISLLKQGYGPWILGVSIPLGAICFLLNWRVRHVDKPQDSVGQSPSALGGS